METLKENPFVILSPDDSEEEITHAPTIHKLFVNVFEDFTTIPQQGHVFINGPRGSGKSMMFRFMLPECQLIDLKAERYNQLKYFSIHVPIKKTNLNTPEFELVRDYGDAIFNEHVLVLYLLEIIFDSFAKLNFSREMDNVGLADEIRAFYTSAITKRLSFFGVESFEKIDGESPKDCFMGIKMVFHRMYVSALQYLKKNAAARMRPGEFSPSTYSGPLFDYLTFLFPIMKEANNISLFPKGKPFFLLIDDADNLTMSQTAVLNTWVSYRTNSEVSLKISTQLKYKTYNTIYGTNIDSPHDYYDINIQTTYSSSKDIYNKRLRQIIQKRLENFYEGKGISCTPDEFFPMDKDQENDIEERKKKVRSNFDTDGKGYRSSDDVTRYVVADYIADLSGSSKSLSTYSYSGFNQLASISSGVIRFFLTPAAKMFNATYRDLKLGDENAAVSQIRFIPPAIQNEVIRDYSAAQLFEEYEKLRKDSHQIQNDVNYLTRIERLRNLIEGVGMLFFEYLKNRKRSERRYFSFVVSDKLDPELKDILMLGVELGYLQLSDIGLKRGSGRTRLFILSRILAPYFKLDPNSFAAYKSFTSDKLLLAMRNPLQFMETYKNSSEHDEANEGFQMKFDF